MVINTKKFYQCKIPNHINNIIYIFVISNDGYKESFRRSIKSITWNITVEEIL